MSRPRFSLVVPAFNEAQHLPQLLASIDAARARLGGAAGGVEVIVADNGSNDATAAIAAARGCRVVRIEKRCIAAARNGGAAAATGDILCFVDADLRIHPRTLEAIGEHIAAGNVAGGASGWTLERWSAGLICTALLARLLTGLARVSAGVIFCRAELFDAIGGYDERRRFAEDVAFFRAMRAAARRRGLRLVRGTGTPAVISTRKFDRHGDWHMLYMWLWVVRNRSLARTVDEYWYDDATRF